ncbi:hypothetical protein Ahy_B10g105514 [Arachis hypogaea]|uniref:Aminotransferase-like plant mobile domain-containing protein n=1 Tax=Arachis hypogaea TaxID=3818 RepID=A0A444X866_ARAHY|nr:hypothetical protein Ahy_B10g105514 [Arachis hypogaea]
MTYFKIMAHIDNHDADINQLNRPRLFLPRRVSHTLPPLDAIVPYLREAGFGDAVPLKNFVFDNSLTTIFVERWCPEIHTFYLP